MPAVASGVIENTNNIRHNVLEVIENRNIESPKRPLIDTKNINNLIKKDGQYAATTLPLSFSE